MQNTAHHELTFIVREQEEGLLRSFLLEHQQISRKSLSKIKFAGDLLLNGKPVTVRATVKVGDEVRVIFPEEEPSIYLHPQPLPLDIIYEDEAVFVLNKPAGLCVHPTFTEREGTLANGVMYYWQQKGLKRTFHAVSRLDKDTSGLILLAQNRFSHQQLAKQQKAKQIVRRYEALVEGSFPEEQGEIVAPIGRKSDSLIEREVREDGQYAKTLYWVKQRFAKFTWLQLQLETGRTHQIRVHLSHLGYPLLGDTLYGGETTYLARQALHASYISFFHPATGEKLSFEAPLPKDMQKLIDVT